MTAILLALIAAPFLLGQPRPGQPVSLYLTVEQGDKLIQGLPQKDFRLYENGQPRQFQLEQPQTPISIVLLVEDSQRSYLYYDDIQAALQGFSDSALEGNWYSLASFDHDLHVDVDFTKNMARIQGAFGELGQSFWNEIDTYDAISATLDKMGQLSGRRVLIFIGSGLDSFSGHTLEDVEKKVQAVDVTIYCVAAGSAFRGYYEPYLGPGSRMNLIEAQAFLRMLADKSGGQAWFPMEQAAYPDVMKGIFQSLQNQYRLVYVPRVPSDGKLHKIKVEAFTINDDKRHDFKVRVREGWRF